ncbi:hypothetical protein BKD30_08430 [Tersicoccus phoenicis]|uniref:Uncharacterized protein n=1 Tax=Tersicoccus phoenicis TaxID=554083 RepID=A0A1R1LAB7_9MICC|nr:hypothetical protein [Tersicoccus phoenicis]OMH24482.1 hypothetical protein BKD30_08430 [Tersicoccus phoenicis]
MAQTPPQLPAAYTRYLSGRDEKFIETVRPALQQSAADGLYGVRVRRAPDEVQAHVDSTVPFGEIAEDLG